MINGVPHMEYGDKFYEGCVLGKYPKNYFSKEASYRAKKVFELVRTDIYGLLTPNSLNKHR
jgi:hypothetical protein